MKHLLLFILSVAAANAQDVVQGRVVAYSDKAPLPGVNVLVKGSARGTVTDETGAFSLAASPSDTLVLSFVGYETLKLPVNGRAELYAELVEGIELLQEIAVFSTGYEQIPAERAAGSFSEIDNDLLNRRASTDLLSRLEGVAPGLLFDRRGETAKLNIRGRSTIFANDQPLIVLDNFPYEGDLDHINPNDIESVTVLKDAAAASIWGVRAGNGVIVIATKTGKRERPLRIGFNARLSAGDKPDLYYHPRLSSSGFIDVERFLFEQGYYDGKLDNAATMPPLSPVVEILARERDGELSGEAAEALLDNYRDEDVRRDLEKYFYRRGLKQQYALDLSGGGEKHAYYFSAGFDKNLSERVGAARHRQTLSVRQSFFPIHGLELTASLDYTQGRTEQTTTLSDIGMSQSQAVYPYARLADDAGNPVAIVRDYRWSFAQNAPAQGLLDWTYRPLAELDYADHTTRVHNIRLGAGLTYAFDEGFSVELRYQRQRESAETRNFWNENTYFARDLVNRFSEVAEGSVARHIPAGGILHLAGAELTAHNGRAQLNYNREWRDHALNALAGFEVREIRTTGDDRRQYGFDEQTGRSQPVDYSRAFRQYPSGSFAAIPGTAGISGTLDRYRSYYANAAYTWLQRYTLSLSGRIDQSNLFGVRSNQKAAPLWSTGVKWTVDRESFYALGWLPRLSLRATYGYNGNVDHTVTAYTTGYFSSDFFYGLTAIGLSSPPNPDLKWERSALLNIGLDFETANGVLSGSVEYFRKQGKDVMGFAPLDPTTGFTSYKGNVAHTKGHGWDIALHSRNIQKAVSWDTHWLFSYAVDEVTRYPEEPTSLNGYFIDASLTGNAAHITPKEGRPLYGIYSYRWGGLDPDTGDPLGYLDGETSADYAAIGSIANTPVDSLVYHGPALPPLFGAVRNTIAWKGWSLSFQVAYRFGYYFRRSSIHYSDLFERYIAHADYEKRWQNPGDEAHTHVPSLIYPANGARDLFYSRSEVLVEKGDNIRLQDVRLAYTLDNKPGAPFRSVEIYALAEHPGLLWTANKRRIDPDFPALKPPPALTLGARAQF